MEEEQIIRDRAANATALAALGNRRKRALDGEVCNQTVCCVQFYLVCFKYLQASSSQPVVGLTGTATSNGGQTVANVFGSAVSYSNVYVCIMCVVNAALLIKVLHQIIDFNTVFIVPWVMM